MNNLNWTAEMEQLKLRGCDWTAGLNSRDWTAWLKSWDWSAGIEQLRLIYQMGLNSYDWTDGLNRWVEQLGLNTWDCLAVFHYSTYKLQQQILCLLYTVKTSKIFASKGKRKIWSKKIKRNEVKKSLPKSEAKRTEKIEAKNNFFSFANRSGKESKWFLFRFGAKKIRSENGTP